MLCATAFALSTNLRSLLAARTRINTKAKARTRLLRHSRACVCAQQRYARTAHTSPHKMHVRCKARAPEHTHARPFRTHALPAHLTSPAHQFTHSCTHILVRQLFAILQNELRVRLNLLVCILQRTKRKLLTRQCPNHLTSQMNGDEDESSATAMSVISHGIHTGSAYLRMVSSVYPCYKSVLEEGEHVNCLAMKKRMERSVRAREQVNMRVHASSAAAS